MVVDSLVGQISHRFVCEFYQLFMLHKAGPDDDNALGGIVFIAYSVKFRSAHLCQTFLSPSDGQADGLVGKKQ